MNIHFISKNDEWSTPQNIFDDYDMDYSFDLDAAANKDNSKCSVFYSKECSGLEHPWFGKVWCNPPYSNVKEWIKKAYEESLRGCTVVMLIPARTDTIAWHTYIFPFAHVRFIKGRLKFSGHKNPAPFPSAIVTFGEIKSLYTNHGVISCIKL